MKWKCTALRADIKDGDYTVALGDINGGNAQAAVIASA